MVQMISDNYVDSVNEEELVSDLIPLLINQLDPHSTYLTAEERQTERETLDGYFYGVGITLIPSLIPLWWDTHNTQWSV